MPDLTADQVRDLYDGRTRELTYNGHILTRNDVDDAWTNIAIGPGDTDEEGAPADHMWQPIADAMTHWHGPTT